MNFTVNNGGQGYRFQPDLLIEGGGGSDLSASVSLKHGVIENIDTNQAEIAMWKVL